MPHSDPGLLRLPPEILSKIFLHTLEGKTILPITLGDCPMSLTMICSKLRRLAISLPNLWSSVFIPVNEEKEKTPHECLLDLWLQRSRSHPLSFMIKQGRWRHNGRTLEAILLRYIGHVFRWRSVVLILCECLHDLLDVIKVQGQPLLESLYLDLKHCDELPDAPRICSWLLEYAPGLRRLGLIYPGAPGTVNVPWSQLTQISIRGISVGRTVWLSCGRLAIWSNAISKTQQGARSRSRQGKFGRKTS